MLVMVTRINWPIFKKKEPLKPLKVITACLVTSLQMPQTRLKLVSDVFSFTNGLGQLIPKRHAYSVRSVTTNHHLSFSLNRKVSSVIYVARQPLAHKRFALRCPSTENI